MQPCGKAGSFSDSLECVYLCMLSEYLESFLTEVETACRHLCVRMFVAKLLINKLEEYEFPSVG